MKKYILVVAILSIMFISAGCETVKGVGRDITGMSDTVENQMSSSGRSRERN